MTTDNHIQISGPFERLFELASDIGRWPEILPHYRWVRILNRQGNTLIAEMAARHKGLPLWWRALRTALPEERRIHFTHIGGITKGMDVDWTFQETQGSELRAQKGPLWHVQIHHRFTPNWPPGGQWFADRVIGKIFVQQVAGKTLRCIKEIMEREPWTVDRARFASVHGSRPTDHAVL